MILVFGGTTEGRIAVNVLDDAGREFYYSTKGELQDINLVHGIHLTGAMTEETMYDFIKEQEIKLVIDAAHPFAEILHQTIGKVTASLNISTIRLERIYSDRLDDIHWCDSYDDMIDKLLSQPSYRLLALTGVNTISKLKRFWSQRESFFRILDRDESREKVRGANFPMDHILYFSPNDDQEVFDKIKPDAVITKESGKSGFFDEKIKPALDAQIPIYAIRRPSMPSHYHTVYGPIGLRKEVEHLCPDFFKLKTGYTTGSTATAATLVAVEVLLNNLDTSCDRMEIVLPSGEPVTLPIDRVERIDEKKVLGVAIKHSGDDPDVTNGAEIHSLVSLREDHQIVFHQGIGVGRVTLPGLGIGIGEPAINATPRKMITEGIRNRTNQGMNVTISVPMGREIAKKTFNPRLGIVDGISIIGTSGVVKPFSLDAFMASIVKQAEVARAQGTDTIVINSGAKSEKYVREAFPSLSPLAFVQYGNFIGETIDHLAKTEIPHIYMGIMLGKAVKLAEGNLDTHSRKVVMNKNFLSTLATELGCSSHTLNVIKNITLARELWDNLQEPDKDKLLQTIADKCLDNAKIRAHKSEVSLMLIDDEGNIRYTSPTSFRNKLYQ